MNNHVISLLRSEEVDLIVSELGRRTFVPGKMVVGGEMRGGELRDVKRNLQLERTGPQLTAIDDIIFSAFKRNRSFQAFAIPQRIVLPLFSRYDPGMEYGTHIDGAMMGGVNGVRTDLAVTLFLTPPRTYDGGELVIEAPIGQTQIKLDAGEAVIYSASSLHHVAQVTRGVRLAAITWVQSAVRDGRLREILYDLTEVSKLAEVAINPGLSLLLGKSYNNLLRFAAEP